MPGLIMMSVITNSYSNVASSFYSAKFQRNVEELLVAPVPNYIIIAGMWAVAWRAALCRPHRHPGVAVLRAAADPSPVQRLRDRAAHLHPSPPWGLINAVFAKSFDDISIIPTFIPDSPDLSGGVFYSITLLPPFWWGFPGEPHHLHGERVPLLPRALGTAYHHHRLHPGGRDGLVAISRGTGLRH